MSDELRDEIEAINSIYSPDSLVQASNDGATDDDLYTLVLPTHPVTLRLAFPKHYPAAPPTIPGVHAVGASKPKGYGSHALALARQVLNTTWTPGQVCIFNLVEELEKVLQTEEEGDGPDGTPGIEAAGVSSDDNDDAVDGPRPAPVADDTSSTAGWIHSDAVARKKSLFVAHATAITHPSQLPALLAGLHATSKNVAKATHNISAYRVRSRAPSTETSAAGSGDRAIVHQDYDDDGETAAGGRLLHLMQIMDAWNVLVVVSRWYGGINLGPDRFRIIGQAAREVLVAGGWGEREGREGGGLIRKNG